MSEYYSRIRRPDYAEPRERRLDYTGEGINTFSRAYHSFLPTRPEYIGSRNMKKIQL